MRALKWLNILFLVTITNSGVLSDLLCIHAYPEQLSTKPSDVSRSACCGICRKRSRSKRITPIEQDTEWNFSSLFHEPELQHSINYIEIKDHIFSENADAIRRFMILGVTFNIVQWLDFIGYHLPIKGSHGVRYFQRIVDYFAAFSRGISEVNPYRATMEFDFIREETLNLWNTVKDNRDTKHIESRNRTTPYRYPQRDMFWLKNWKLHSRDPLCFVGIPEEGRQYQIESLLKMLVEFEDKFYQLLTGQMPIPKSLHALIHPLKLRKFFNVFWWSYFESSGLRNIEIFYKKRNLIQAITQMLNYLYPLDQRKRTRFYWLSLMFNVLNTAAMIAESQMGIVESALFWVTPLPMHGQKFIKMEFRFGTEVISDQRQKVINREIKYLLESGSVGQMTFEDLQENPGELLFLHMLVMFADVKGQCGIGKPLDPDTATYQQSIFCIWSVEQESIGIRGPYNAKSEWMARSQIVGGNFSEQQFESLEGSSPSGSNITIPISGYKGPRI